MIDSDLKFLETELNEELAFFENIEGYKIRHKFSEKEDRVVNTIIVNGKAYAYGNYIGKITDELVRKRLIKRYAKLSLYKAISALTNQNLPWGALTGVRPTKLAYQSIEENGEFEDFFESTMKVSKEKTDIVKRVLQSQTGIYEQNSNNCDLFVFIPFCPSRCKYCSFITQAVNNSCDLENRYVDNLIDEIKYSKEFIKDLRSIYIGGGTPVALNNANLERVLNEVSKINCGVEFTVEAGRPDVITKDNVKLLKDYGVNRVCVNPQTFVDETLKLIGRNHTSKDIFKAYELVKNEFTVNMDLIAGFENETLEDFKSTIDKTVELNPDNITVHTLCVKKGAYLKDEEIKVNENVEQMIEYSEQKLIDSGYNPYYLYRQKYQAKNLENIGYSKKGKECIYNIDSMEEIASCVACGANGISKIVNFGENKIERYATPKDVKTYIDKKETIKVEKTEFFKENGL